MKPATLEFQRTFLILLSSFLILFNKHINDRILMSVLIGIFIIYISYYFFIKKDYNLISITTTIFLVITILVKLYLKC